MIKRLNTVPPLNLARNKNDLPLTVEMEAFFDFSFWMAEELQDLISQHEMLNGPVKQGKPLSAKKSPTDAHDAPFEDWVEWE